MIPYTTTFHFYNYKCFIHIKLHLLQTVICKKQNARLLVYGSLYLWETFFFFYREHYINRQLCYPKENICEVQMTIYLWVV